MKASVPIHWKPLALCALATFLIGWTAGCNVDVLPGTGGADRNGSAGETNGNDNSDDTNDNADALVDPNEVLVRFLNLTDVDVDTEFYAANEPLADPTTELFSDAYLVQAGIGVFGSGVVLAGQTDEIVLPCADATALGTAGGRYLDPDLGTVLAEGQTRLVTAGLNFDCGNTLIFSFRGAAGDYTTEPVLVDFTD